MARRFAPVALILAVALFATPAASASLGYDTMSAYSSLASAHRNPAPLVATSVPAALENLSTVVVTYQYQTNQVTGPFYILYTHGAKGGPDANMLLRDVGKSSLKKEKRRDRKLYKARKATVRGKPGLAFTKRKGHSFFLAWIEDGRLYLL